MTDGDGITQLDTENYKHNLTQFSSAVIGSSDGVPPFSGLHPNIGRESPIGIRYLYNLAQLVMYHHVLSSCNRIEAEKI